MVAKSLKNEIEKDQKGESFLAYSNEAGRNDLTVIYNKAGRPFLTK